MPRRIRRTLGRVLSALNQRLIPHVPIGDPWERVISRLIAPHLYGPGSRRKFSWYMEGVSAVRVETIAELCQWLVECEYVSDNELFNEDDLWQHPRTFENVRKGDCEDHALWAWRKLIELGHPAEFFVGSWQNPDCWHGWVVFERDGDRYLLEATSKDPSAMIRPLRDMQAEYSPYFSVDQQFTMWSYAGYLQYLRDREVRRRANA